MTRRSQSKIYFFFQQPVRLDNRTRLKTFIEALFKREQTGLENLNYIFCTDEELLGINRQYLKHDFYTDIITFGLSAKGEPVNGEIYISVDRVKDNARTIGATINQELHRVIIHGALHLCGYRDKKAAEKKKMTEKEDYYLLKFFGKRST
jgi:probable rRNA maturation factor